MAHGYFVEVRAGLGARKPGSHLIPPSFSGVGFKARDGGQYPISIGTTQTMVVV
jgi:hypothetical protein